MIMIVIKVIVIIITTKIMVRPRALFDGGGDEDLVELGEDDAEERRARHEEHDAEDLPRRCARVTE